MRTLMVLAAAVAVSSPVTAQDRPDSCVAADKARQEVLRDASKGNNPADVFLYGSDAGQVRSQRQANDQTRLITVGRLCVGDLAAQKRMQEAIQAAFQFGLYDDANLLQRGVRAMEASGQAH